jgi:hypothetical protein
MVAHAATADSSAAPKPKSGSGKKNENGRRENDLTTEQQDWADDNARRIQLNKQTPELFEVVRKTQSGYDPREGSTFYKTERLGVYSSELAALRAALKLSTDLSVQPLKVDG